MTDPTQTTGTPDQDGGDAAEVEQTTGTPATDDRNADNGINREEALVWKSKAERVNAAEAEAKLLKAQNDALIRAQSPAARGSDPRAERLATVQRFADGSIGEGPDPVAAELLALRGELAMTVQELANVRELDRVSDEDKRRKIAEHFNNNRNRLGDVKAARAEIDAEELAGKLEDERLENEKLRKVIAASKRPVNAVETHTREVSAAEHKETMTRAEWANQKAELERRRDAGDTDAGKALHKHLLAHANGKVTLKD